MGKIEDTNAVISIIPGPSVFMVIGQSLSRGAKAAFACIMRDIAGGVIVMSTSYLGLGLLLASSSIAFMVLKWAGVIYMAFLAQFIEPTDPQLPQFFILMATPTLVVALVLGGYALLAAKVGACLQSLGVRKRMGDVGGSCLLGRSVLMAATR